jgi:O-antigen ligase
LIALAVVRSFSNARDVGPIFLLLCVGQYLWWGLMGVKSGAVWWHPNLGNFDGYGPIMACGVGPGYYYAMSTKSPWRRRLGLFASALSVLGVVSAFARGGVLALIVTVAYIWFRSPKKGRATVVVVAGFLLVVIAASMIDGSTRGDDTRSNFWDEMSTMFDDSGGSTGDDRKQLWAAAVMVWKAHPVLGVGAANFGPAAVTIIQHGDLPGSIYDDNPLKLYGRALHSNYFQLLSEFGIAGVCLYVYMIVEFYRRSRYIRRRARYIDLTPAQIHDVGSLALGLESGLVGYLVTGIFFNQLYQSWFFALVIANALLYKLAKRTEVRAPLPLTLTSHTRA